jgi:GT2 family glycosyltransferase
VAAVAIIVVSWNTRQLLAECLDSIARTTAGMDAETTVVDNASADGSAAMVRERFPAVRLIENPINAGFAPATNQGVAATGAAAVLMLNSDAQLCPGALQTLLARLDASPRAGLVGAELRNHDGTFQFSHARFPTLGRELLVLSGLGRLLYGRWYPSHGPDAAARAAVVDWVGGACLLARRAAFDAVGGFDERYRLYGEELDLAYRMRQAGWEVWYEPAARVLHHGAASTSKLSSIEARLYRARLHFFRAHHGAAAARALAAQMVAFSLGKMAVHGALRAVSRGRYGRRVIGWQALRAALATADEPRGPMGSATGCVKPPDRPAAGAPSAGI